MSGGKGGGGDVPDFNKLLKTQAQLNRVNVISPFGTAQFGFQRGGRFRQNPRGGGGGGGDNNKSLANQFSSFNPSSAFLGVPGGNAGGTGGGPGGDDGNGGVGGGIGGPSDPGGGRGDSLLPFDLQQLLSRGGGGGLGRIPDTLRIQLSPNQRRILRRRERAQISLGGLTNNLISDFGTGEGARERIEDALFSRGERLLNPQFDRQFNNLETSLANRGLPLTSDAFRTSVGDFNRGRDQAFLDLSDRSVLAGGQEQSRQLNQILGLLSGQQVQNPTVLPPSPVDVTGPASVLQQQNAADQSAKGNLFGAGLGAAGTLGAAALLASSRDFKTNPRPVESVLPRIERLEVEAWDYKPGIDDGGTHIGPYAEEFAELFGVGNGRTIHPVDAIGVCLLAIKELNAKLEDLEWRTHG